MDNQQNILNELDKKIILKYRKIKGKNKTHIYGIEKVLDAEKLEDFLKKIKKKLGCGGVVSEDEEKTYVIEFMGDHRLKIKEMLLEEKVLPSNKIEMKGA